MDSTIKKAAGPTCKDSGIDIAADEDIVVQIRHHIRQTCGPNVIETPGGYARLFSLNPDGLLSRTYRNPVLVSTTGGIGDKLKIAFMAGKHDTVGVDLVAMNVNDLLCVGAEPLFFLDYIAADRIRPETLVQVVKGMSDGCREAGCALLGGETAEIHGSHPVGEYDLAGFAVGIVEESRRLNAQTAKPGDSVIGIASSGLHSNDYSLVRKLFFEKAAWSIDRYVEEFGCTLGEELLKPATIYARPVKKVIGRYRNRIIKAVAHIGKGGFLGNLPRVIPQHADIRVARGTWPVPPVFSVIQQLGDIPDEEMYGVFNMGIGMVLIVSATSADLIIRLISRMGFNAYLIGEILPGRRRVLLNS